MLEPDYFTHLMLYLLNQIQIKCLSVGCNKCVCENVPSLSRVSEACTEDMGARFSER